jgi:hypothetical protein
MDLYESPDPADEERKRLIRRAVARAPLSQLWLRLLRPSGPRRLTWSETVRVRAGERELGPQPSEARIAAWYGPRQRPTTAPIDWSAELPDVPHPDLG